MFAYLSKHLDSEVTVIDSQSTTTQFPNKTSNNQYKFFSSKTNSTSETINPSPVSAVRTMSLPKEETLSMVDPEEISIPVPWGHVAGKITVIRN